MAPRSLPELMGLRITASLHWTPHVMVGLSALLLLMPAIAFVAVLRCIARCAPNPYSTSTRLQLLLYAILAFLFTSCCLTCFLADYVYIRRGHRSFYGKFDIRLATLTFCLCILDFALRASFLETWMLVCISVSAFCYSGISTSTSQWVFRHSLWHLVAGSDGTYGAMRLPPEGAHVGARVWLDVFIVGCGSTFATLVIVAVFRFALSESTRGKLWDWGAQYADWQQVVLPDAGGSEPSTAAQRGGPSDRRDDPTSSISSGSSSSTSPDSGSDQDRRGR
ncbi:unnamed protein product [Prorocentrum cordatum]|uniref:Uncharacterized protein n=1 Tax=Prorocentrum cordatum TaxID=2364126 RepID=A0ABN9TRH0_9DINO|nr:unnamed protein product [Polarella glacialis]